MKYPLLLVTILALASCGNRESTQQSSSDTTQIDPSSTVLDSTLIDVSEDIQKYLVNNEEEIEDSIFTVNEPAIISIDFTAQQMADLQQQYDEETFMTIMDDASYYHSTAMMTADTLGIKNLSTQHRFIKMVGKKSWIFDVQREQEGFWSLILFHPSKQPIVVAPIGIDKELLKDYFEVK